MRGRKKKEVRFGIPFDQATSAMQKEIRRGDEEAACYWMALLCEASPWYAWKRILIRAAEDVGLADPQAVLLVSGLNQMWQTCKEKSYYVDPQHIYMAVMALCRAKKSTEVDDMKNYTQALIRCGQVRDVPAYAIDKHTAAGRDAGKTDRDWYEDRHGVCGVPINDYTRELWDLMPEVAPEPAAREPEPTE